ncbi:MAG TPA: DUF6491 family protein [Caulobacteraceae bacterium]|jgi:hypothetical protein
MRKQLMAVALAAVAVGFVGGPALAQGQSCLYANQWTSWKAPDDHTIYLNVGNRVFRLDIGGSCPTLRQGATLITHSHSAQLCSAIDWDLRVRSGGMTTGCIVSNMTQLTPDQIAALPKDARP